MVCSGTIYKKTTLVKATTLVLSLCQKMLQKNKSNWVNKEYNWYTLSASFFDVMKVSEAGIAQISRLYFFKNGKHNFDDFFRNFFGTFCILFFGRKLFYQLICQQERNKPFNKQKYIPESFQNWRMEWTNGKDKKHCKIQRPRKCNVEYVLRKPTEADIGSILIHLLEAWEETQGAEIHSRQLQEGGQ